MSNSEEKKQNTIEASDEVLTLEDLELDISEPSMTFTATLHFEFSDIFNAIEHIETEAAAETTELDSEPTAEPEPESEITEPEPELEQEPELEPESPAEALAVTESNLESESAQAEPESEEAEPAESDSPEEIAELETELAAEPETKPEAPASEVPVETEPEIPAPDPAKAKPGIIARLRGQDKGTKKLVLTDIILLAVVVISIVAGLSIAHSIVDKANAANEAKIAEMQANIKEVKLAENLYNLAVDQVIDDIAVPTYSLDELYALDLREKTGFTAEDLKIITSKGLVGCEEAFAKAEETYGVNSIFLISIASLESAHGTMMFRPNNMFGYGRTGFASKEECIMTVAKGLGTRYLPPGGSLYGGSPTLKGVNKRYAANPQWYYKVGKYMQGYYAELAAAKNGALDKFE